MRFVTTFFLIVTNIWAYSQTSSIVSASNQSESASLKSSWTVGDLIPEEFISSSLVATPGIDATAQFIITGDIDSDESTSTVYPVPFERELFIETSREDLTEAQIVLLDMSGRVIESHVEHLSAKKARVNTTTITTGAYLLLLKTQSQTKTFKLVKQ